MWRPDYDRNGQPFTADDPSLLTPAGELESGRRFLFGARGSRRQRKAFALYIAAVLAVVALFVVVALIAA
jgi:hypothetical protein